MLFSATFVPVPFPQSQVLKSSYSQHFPRRFGMRKLLTVLFAATIGLVLSMPATAQDNGRAQDRKEDRKEAKRGHHRHKRHHKQARKQEKMERKQERKG
jgi:hypothetical protein